MSKGSPSGETQQKVAWNNFNLHDYSIPPIPTARSALLKHDAAIPSNADLP